MSSPKIAGIPEPPDLSATKVLWFGTAVLRWHGNHRVPAKIFLGEVGSPSLRLFPDGEKILPVLWSESLDLQPRPEKSLLKKLAWPAKVGWLYGNPKAIASVRRGVAQARKRRFAKPPPDAAKERSRKDGALKRTKCFFCLRKLTLGTCATEKNPHCRRCCLDGCFCPSKKWKSLKKKAKESRG